jgi:hypothetical protein
MINDLICLANELDEEGFLLEANYLDLIIKQASLNDNKTFIERYREGKISDIVNLIFSLSSFEAGRPTSILEEDKNRIKSRIKEGISEALRAAINDATTECREAPRASEVSFEEESLEEDLDVGYMPGGINLL